MHRETYYKITGSIWFRWLARLILLFSAVAAFTLSFFPSLHGLHYVDAEHAVSRIGPGIAVVFTLPLIIIAAVAWRWWRAGGLTGIIWSIALLAMALLYSSDTEIYFLIWGGVFLGGIMHVFTAGKKEPSVIAEEKLKWSAIIISFLSPLCYVIIFILVFLLKLPAGLGAGLFYIPFAIVIAVIAIYKPSLGGPLMVFSGSLLFSAALMTDHYPQYYVPVSSFSIIGGVLHLIGRYR